MVDGVSSLLGSEGLRPYGECLLWTPELIGLHAAGNLLTAGPYFALTLAILIFSHRRPDLVHRGIARLFAAFIFLCALVNLVDFGSIWVPLYGIEGALKLMAGLVSVATAVVVWPMMRRAFVLPSPAMLKAKNDEYERELGRREAAEHKLRRARVELELRVEERTRALAESNHRLRAEIREREDAQRALAEAKRRAEDARIAAERANAAKSDFLAKMSHDFRTPLNAIIGFSETMHSGIFGLIDNARYRDYMRDILASGRYLLSMIDEVLDLAKIESGRMTIHPEPLDLREVAEEGLRQASVQAERKQIKLRFKRGAQPAPIFADPRAVPRMINNLLSNALKFTPDGGQVTLQVETFDNEVHCRVTDTGPGIPAQELRRVLAPFEQGEAGKKAGEGTGLGLTIVRSIMGMHRGRLMVGNRPQGGVEAVLVFPNLALFDRGEEAATQFPNGNAAAAEETARAVI